MLNNINKVVISSSHAGFGLSEEAKSLYRAKTGEAFDAYAVQRHCPALVAVVEELGLDANRSPNATVKVEAFTGRLYRVEEYEGLESITTPNTPRLFIEIT